MTPERAAEPVYYGANGRIPTTILGQRTLPSGAQVMLYRAEDAMPDGKHNRRFLIYSVVERSGSGGWTLRSSGPGSDSPPPAGTFIEYGTGSVDPDNPVDPNDPVLVYGVRLVPEVLAVEATFDNGQIVRDATADGIFVLATTNANALCELRVLGENDAVLHIFGAPQSITYGPNGPPSDRCG